MLDFNIKRLVSMVPPHEREVVLSGTGLIRETSFSEIAAVANTSTTKYTTKPHPGKRTSRYRQKPPNAQRLLLPVSVKQGERKKT